MEREIVTPEELLRRAESIKALSLSEPFRWLVKAAENDAHRDWENGKSVEERERAFMRLTGVQSLDLQVRRIVDAGIRAAREMEKVQKQK